MKLIEMMRINQSDRQESQKRFEDFQGRVEERVRNVKCKQKYDSLIILRAG
jgi:hypothetical protein